MVGNVHVVWRDYLHGGHLMRIHKIGLGDLQLDLSVTFGVAREIKEKVADLMLIAQEASLAQRMGAAGIAYRPKFEFGVENIPLILFIGAKPNHPDLKLSEVQDAVCEAGFGVGMAVADGFLTQFIAPRAKEKIETKGDAKPGE
jgi:hypothetical protein